MSREEALRKLLESEPGEETKERLERLEQKLDLILSVFVVQQKDVCEAVGISPDAIRNKALRGELEILQADGSRLNYIALKDAVKLKPRRKTKRRK